MLKVLVVMLLLGLMCARICYAQVAPTCCQSAYRCPAQICGPAYNKSQPNPGTILIGYDKVDQVSGYQCGTMQGAENVACDMSGGPEVCGHYYISGVNDPYCATSVEDHTVSVNNSCRMTEGEFPGC